MTDDIRLAFAHPSERAAAMADPSAPVDRISLRDYIVEVEIGAFQQERGLLQRVRFNVVVEVRPQSGPLDDDVDRILSYDRVTEAIGAELAAERINLLETLAARVAERILREPQALRVFVRIEKIDRGPFALGVEIVRAKSDLAGLAEASSPGPRVVYLGPDAAASGHLKRWVDQLAGAGGAILCVGPGEAGRPQSGEAVTQRRIDLLAIEQQAWLLAARDRRCAVVQSRTELDWAMTHGQVCIWAPGRIVLDAVDGPRAPVSDGPALAGWLAGMLAARELLVIGAPAPDSAVPTRGVSGREPGLGLER